MSKKEQTNGNVTNGNTEQAPAPERPSVSKKDKLILFKAYEDADVKVKEFEAKLEAARVARSQAVSAIHDACGKGPFSYKGEELRVMSRKGTFFFRGAGSEVDVIA